MSPKDIISAIGDVPANNRLIILLLEEHSPNVQIVHNLPAREDAINILFEVTRGDFSDLPGLLRELELLIHQLRPCGTASLALTEPNGRTQVISTCATRQDASEHLLTVGRYFADRREH